MVTLNGLVLILLLFFFIYIQEAKLVSNVVRKATSHESVQMQVQVSRKALLRTNFQFFIKLKGEILESMTNNGAWYRMSGCGNV